MEFFGDNGMEGLQTMGIINALKTGNVHFDMIIAMIIPVAFGFLFSSFDKIKDDILTYFDCFFQYCHPPKKYYERNIRHSKDTNSYYSSSSQDDSKNETLIKAIFLYLDHHHIMKLQNANIELQSIQKQNTRNYYYWYNNDNESKSVADTLKKYKVIKKPITNEWVHLDVIEHMTKYKQINDNQNVADVEMIIQENQTNVNNGNDATPSRSKTELTLHFRSESESSIDQFIDNAYKWYLDELKKLEDNSRYLYELIDPIIGDEERSNCARYKKYQLSDEKTFESLFFQEKDSILKLVNHFTKKTGKYAIKGYPHKLGLLLHGPPGTGKTSLIKALAHLTGRSIVNVPLARISTNAQLASLFFDQKYYVEGEDVPIQLSFKDVIFVMEDVDAVSKVVRRRDGKKTNDITYTERLDMTMPVVKPIWRMLLESRNETCRTLVKKLMEKSSRLKKYAQDPHVLNSIARRMTALPHLSLVGEKIDNQKIQKVADEAVADVGSLMEQYGILDDFIASHAEVLLELLDSGAELNKSFEDELLGISKLSSTSRPGSFLSLIPKQEGVDSETSNTSILSDDSEEDYLALISSNICDDAISSNGEKKSNNKQLGPKLLRHQDELNLSGLLNVLDGVVDTPGRMLVMTTNHPDMLDPALIRPGRIDKRLLLGYMTYADVVCMIEHFFQTKVDDEHCKRLRSAINGESKRYPLRLTPAEIEQMAAENDKVEDIVSALENKSHSAMLANTHGLGKI